LRQIRLACKRGELPEYLIGSWPRVAWNDVLAWLERNRITGHAAGAELRAQDPHREHET
jgi:hypothetical protein